MCSDEVPDAPWTSRECLPRAWRWWRLGSEVREGRAPPYPRHGTWSVVRDVVCEARRVKCPWVKRSPKSLTRLQRRGASQAQTAHFHIAGGFLLKPGSFTVCVSWTVMPPISPRMPRPMVRVAADIVEDGRSHLHGAS